MRASASGRRTLGVGIIGSGLMAKAHTMAWRNLRSVYGQIPVEIRLVVLVDATDELAAAGAGQFGYERSTTSWQDVVEDPAVDIVDIVTPNFLHKEVAIAAARAGKHIWCEKPLALTADDALEMTKVAEDSGVKTLVGFSYLRNPGVVLAKKLVQDGEIGKPVSFTGTFAIDAMTHPGTPFTWRQDRALAGTGALGDLGAHIIAFARHLVGPIERVASLSTITVPRRPLPAGTFGYGEKAEADAPMREVENDDVTIFSGGLRQRRDRFDRGQPSIGRPLLRRRLHANWDEGRHPLRPAENVRAASAPGIRSIRDHWVPTHSTRSGSRGLWRAVASARDQHQRSRSEVLRGTRPD